MYQNHVDYKFKPTIKHRPKNTPTTNDNSQHCERRAGEGSDSTHEKAALDGRKIGEKMAPSYAVADDRAIPLQCGELTSSVNERTDTERCDQSTDTRCEKGGACSCHQNGDVYGIYQQNAHDPVNHPTHYTQNNYDPVNHPRHYTQGGIECIDAIQAAVTGLKGMEAVCVGNAIKYIWRTDRKNGCEDIDKAIWYLMRLKKVRKDRGKR